MKENMSKALFIAFMASLSITLTGCLSSPTYGTDKSATEQLMDDLGNMVSFQTAKGQDIKYQPRADIVTPPSTAQLPEPQQSVVENEQVWPESPEEVRERLVAEATENQGKPGYRSPLAGTNYQERKLTRKEQAEAYRQARAVQKGQYSERRYLSDPPAGYKTPAETAPIGDVGETEKEKEKRRLAGATVDGTGKKWWQVWKR